MPRASSDGAITIYFKGVKLENMMIVDNATTGLFVGAMNVSLKNVTSVIMACSAWALTRRTISRLSQYCPKATIPSASTMVPSLEL